MITELYLFEGTEATYGFTPSIFSKTYNAVIYAPTIVKRSKIKIEQNDNKNEVSFTFPKSHFYAVELLTEIPETPIQVTIYRKDSTVGPDYDTYYTGRVISAEAKTLTIEIKCDSLFSTMKRSFMAPKLSVICWAAWSSEQCGVDKNLWGNVYNVSATSTEVFVSGLAEPAGYYNNGLAVLGVQQRRIITNSATHIHLSAPFIGTTSGDITLYPGCQLTEEACASFNNLINHKGFKNIPWKNPYGNTGLL